LDISHGTTSQDRFVHELSELEQSGASWSNLERAGAIWSELGELGELKRADQAEAASCARHQRLRLIE